MNYQIRTITKEDAPALARIEAICFPKAEAASLSTLEKRIAVFGDCFFAAVYQEEIIGFINGCVTNETTIQDIMFEDSHLHHPNGAYQCIFGLDVLPSFQRQGIAAALMQHMIDTAKTKKRQGLLLTCKKELLHYYEKFGYQNMGISASTHGDAVWYDMQLILHKVTMKSCG